ncbi:MAG: hypothetical protein HY898_08170 [Deltaproteobacteria bacterium]|nr:hypothetical protein [Deltaproteobacteria bacterium]
MRVKHMSLGLAGVALIAAVVAAACSSSDEAAPPATTPGEDAGEEADAIVAVETGAEAEAQVEAGPDPTAVCKELQLPSRPFEDVTSDPTLRAKASDFTVKTTAGDWNLKASWSGCDSYVFIQDRPKQNQGFEPGMWENVDDFPTLFANTPKNVHYFFASNASDAAKRTAALDALKVNVDAALSALTAEEQKWWSGRIHYIPSSVANLPVWIGKLMVSPGWGVAIDRSQRIRYVGSYADPSRYEAAQGWFAPNVSMAANEPVYYNFEASREERLAAENATVVGLWKGIAVGGGDPYLEVTLPDAATMAGFDTMEIDLSMTCGGKGEFGVCPQWDYDAFLHLCEDSPPDAGAPDAADAEPDAADAEPDAGPPPPYCPHEIGHWITSYHREGRWVHDVSGILPLLAKGGVRKLKMTITDPWVIDASLRFFNKAKPVKPSETIPLFIGQHTFDEKYNDNYVPMKLTIPADAQKVEIASVITGHGMSSPGNCAEFCNTDHHFIVNGTDNKRDFPMVSDQLGCMAQIVDGTVPNQYGTWWYGRGGWCPGKHVEMVMMDITSQVTKGAENNFEYQGFWKGKVYTNGNNWRHIHMSSWLLISR